MREFDGTNCGEREESEKLPGEEGNSTGGQFVFEGSSAGVTCYNTGGVAVACYSEEGEYFEAGDSGTS